MRGVAFGVRGSGDEVWGLEGGGGGQGVGVRGLGSGVGGLGVGLWVRGWR